MPTTSAEPAERVAQPVVSNPEVQYIASSVQYPFIRTDIILAPTMDEAEIANGVQIYDDMAYDPTMAGLQLWAKTQTLEDGLTIQPRNLADQTVQGHVTSFDMSEAIWAQGYVKFVLSRLEMLDRPLFSILWNMLDGARLPHKLAEITFDTILKGEFAGLPGIASIRPKPRSNYNYVVDEMMTFRGIIGLVPGGSQAKWSGIVYDAAQIPNCIAPEKLMSFSMDNRDGDPRGKSGWSGCYQPWARTQMLYREMMATAQNAAGGKVAVVLGEEQRATTFVNPVTGQNETLLDRTHKAISRWGNNGTLTLNHGSIPYVFYPSSGALDGFINGIQESKREMAMAFLTNSRAIFEAEHGSKADTDAGQDNTDPVKRLLRKLICQMMSKVFYNLLKLARGEEYALAYSPTAHMNKASAPDFSMNGMTVSALENSGVITPSQIASYSSEKLGISPPTPEEMVLLTDKWIAGIKYSIDNPGNSGKMKPENPSTGKPEPKEATK